ncbi:hypothetical protein LIER_18292 [Lithospermum erythrorhizon]|uniref:Integrase zinc-binding domain-containing protein n=1 Tax=Lithospermum erythrorhizon TaxID=34254 RepID=A0AAV3QEF4_LITER
MKEEEDWRSPITRFILMGELPNDGVKARKIKSRSYKFQMIQGELYKRSHLGPLLFCVAKRNIDQVVYEVHEGEVCGHHMGGQSLVLKITRAGYFWPTMMNDAMEYVKRCDSCQKMQPVPRRPVAEMTPVLCPISFAIATCKTPFSLVYDTEVVLPLEACLPNIRQIGFEEDQNDTQMRGLLDFGPSRVKRVVGPETYILEELSEKDIDHTWHGIYLKKYYV